MTRITSLDDLNNLKIDLVVQRNQKAKQGLTTVTVGMGTCGIAAGALDVLRTIESEVKAHNLKGIIISQTGCMGLCSHEPIVEIGVGAARKVVYGKVDNALVKRIIQEHLLEGKPVEDHVIDTTPFPTI